MCLSTDSKLIPVIVVFSIVLTMSLSARASEVTYETFEDWEPGVFRNTTAEGFLSGLLRLGYEDEFSEDLQGFWRLDEEHGSSSLGDQVTDYSGHGRHGDTVDGVETGVPGILSDNAYSFGVDEEHVYVPHDDSFDSDSFTVAGWFRAEPDSEDLNTIISKQDSHTDRHFWVTLDGDDSYEGDGVLWVRTSVSTGDLVDISSSEGFDDGEWHHFAFVHDMEEENATLYVDGEIEGYQEDITPPEGMGEDIGIGVQHDSVGDTERYFDGDVSNIMFFDTPKTREDISDIYLEQGDGNVEGYYESDVISGDVKREWKRVNVTSEVYGDNYLELVFRSLDEQGETLSEQEFEVTGGEESFELDVDDSEESMYKLEGNTSEIEDSWTVDEVVVEHDVADENVSLEHLRPDDGRVFDSSVTDVDLEFEIESESGDSSVDGDVDVFVDGEKVESYRKDEGTTQRIIHEETGLEPGEYEWHIEFESDLSSVVYTSEPTSFEILDEEESEGMVLQTQEEWNQGIFEGTTADFDEGGFLTLGYRNESSAGDLLGYWRLDDDLGIESDGDTVTDYSGFGNDGETVDGVDTGMEGILGKTSFEFSPEEDFVFIDSSPELDTSTFTVSGWFRNEPDAEGLNTIVSRQGSGGNSDRHFWVVVDSTAEHVDEGAVWAKNSFGGSDDVDISSSGGFDDGEWHHFAFVHDMSDDRAELYVNGELEGYQDDINEPEGFGEPAAIGAEIEGERSEVRRFFEGNISDIRFTSGAKSEDEVVDHSLDYEDGVYQGSYSRTFERFLPVELEETDIQSEIGSDQYVSLEVKGLEDGNPVESQLISLEDGEQSEQLQLDSVYDEYEFFFEGETEVLEENWRVFEKLTEFYGAEALEPYDGYYTTEDTVEFEYGVDTSVPGEVELVKNEEVIRIDETEEGYYTFTHTEEDIEDGEHDWKVVLRDEDENVLYETDEKTFEIADELEVDFELISPEDNFEDTGEQDITFEYNVTSNQDDSARLVKNGSALSVDTVSANEEENIQHTETVEPGYYEWEVEVDTDTDYAVSETRSFTLSQRANLQTEMEYPETLVEDRETFVNVSVTNEGDFDTGDFNTELSISNYEGSWEEYVSEEERINLDPGEEKEFEYVVEFEQGPNLLEFEADTDDEVDSSPESEKVQKEIEDVSGYNIFYGGASKNIRLMDSDDDFSAWISQNPEGSILFMDSDAEVDFDSLEPVSLENIDLVDESLDTVHHNDSVEELWDGSEYQCFDVSGEVCDVLVADSSEYTDDYKTGILYEQQESEEFDGSQPLVFVTEPLPEGEGIGNGDHDYEARVPANLRTQVGEDTETVTIYEILN